MKIGVLGTGRMGSELARLWAAQGHDVMLGSREASKAQTLAAELGHGMRGGTQAEAAQFGDVLLLATPWHAAEGVVKSLPPLAGKILIDCTNPIAEGGLAVGHTTSAAEQIAGWAPGARVVKAFNGVHFRHLARPLFGEQRMALFYCGDDPDAGAVAAGLAAEIGFEPVDSGPLANARLLEPLALLWIRLATSVGHGPDIAFALLRR